MQAHVLRGFRTSSVTAHRSSGVRADTMCRCAIQRHFPLRHERKRRHRQRLVCAFAGRLYLLAGKLYQRSGRDRRCCEVWAMLSSRTCPICLFMTVRMYLCTRSTRIAFELKRVCFSSLSLCLGLRLSLQGSPDGYEDFGKLAVPSTVSAEMLGQGQLRPAVRH